RRARATADAPVVRDREDLPRRGHGARAARPGQAPARGRRARRRPGAGALVQARRLHAGAVAGRSRDPRGAQARRPAAARRGRAPGAAAGAHRDRRGAARQPEAGQVPAADPAGGRLALPLGGSVVAVRAIRGAIQVDGDTREEILKGSAELVSAVLERNELTADDIISIIFTATPDLTAEFPAYAARLLGLTDVPLLCATEIAV